VLAFQQKSDGPSARLIVTRDEGYLGGGCYLALWINGTLAARLDPGETSHFYVAPGEAILRVGYDPQGKGLCALSPSDEWTERETVLKSDEEKHFRILLDLNGKTDIQRTD
jgi:hypothetical protein